MSACLTATLLAALLVAQSALVGCSGPDTEADRFEFNGPTMGTRFSVQVVRLPATVDRDALGLEITAQLERINKLMSTYDPGSELSRFNACPHKDWFAVSAQTAAVVDEALTFSRITAGAFDVTVGPLVNLWGFGPDLVSVFPPADQQIAEVSARVGYSKLEVRLVSPALRKSQAGVYVDLSAIAKGYAVDRLAALLRRYHIANYLIDIGGEIRVSGSNAAGAPWRLAIERPQAGKRVPSQVLHLNNGAVATSGNYRNFREFEGVRYAHTIDPRSGRPVQHTLLAVTVVADTAMVADGWATALMVLGEEAGRALAEEHEIAALFQSGSDDEPDISRTGAMRAVEQLAAYP